MYFELDMDERCWRDENSTGESRWDYTWSEDWDYDYHGVMIADGYGDVALFPNEKEAKIGDDIYVVFVSYDSGDSFGWANNKRIYLWAFTDKKAAYGLEEMIETNHEKNKLDFRGVHIGTSDWNGYFEKFNYVEVLKLAVRRKKLGRK